jgi:hypothetical protein
MRTRIILLVTVCCLLVSALGCDSFVRKFTRKSNKDKEAEVEMVLAPEEYKSMMTKDDYYRQYLLYWKSWQGELIESLNISGRGNVGGNYKKQKDCVNQAITNLINMRTLLNPDLEVKLDKYISRMNVLKDSIVSDPYSNLADSNRQQAEQLRRDILKNFSYNYVKASLK